MDTATIRASSFWEVLDCPKRWASKYIEGLRTPATAPARIGTAVHRSTAVYDESRVEGTDFVSIDDSADVVVDTIRNPDEEVDWMGMNIDKAIEIGVGCHTKYCSEIGSHMEFAAVEQTLEDLTVGFAMRPTRNTTIRAFLSLSRAGASVT
jgi:nucleoside-diphosphate-sugar epimerase